VDDLVVAALRNNLAVINQETSRRELEIGARVVTSCSMDVRDVSCVSSMVGTYIPRAKGLFLPMVFA
jgi:hypothetical protein